MKTIITKAKELSEYKYLLKDDLNLKNLQYTEIQELHELFKLMEHLSGKSMKYSDLSYVEKLQYRLKRLK